MTRPEPTRRGDYKFYSNIQTRWSDNDMFGHVNNVEYYRFFELAVVEFLMRAGEVDLMNDPVVPFAAESLCRFRRPLSWPHPVTAALRVEQLGTSSVRYGIALFEEGSDEPAAEGHWVHVFVTRADQRPTPIPDALRAMFERHR